MKQVNGEQYVAMFIVPSPTPGAYWACRLPSPCVAPGIPPALSGSTLPNPGAYWPRRPPSQYAAPDPPPAPSPTPGAYWPCRPPLQCVAPYPPLAPFGSTLPTPGAYWPCRPPSRYAAQDPPPAPSGSHPVPRLVCPSSRRARRGAADTSCSSGSAPAPWCSPL